MADAANMGGARWDAPGWRYPPPKGGSIDSSARIAEAQAKGRRAAELEHERKRPDRAELRERIAAVDPKTFLSVTIENQRPAVHFRREAFATAVMAVLSEAGLVERETRDG